MSDIAICPVCRCAIRSTTRGNIGYHLDSLSRNTCPAYGQPWHITGAEPRIA